MRYHLALPLVLLVAVEAASAQEPAVARYHERTDETTVFTTPGGPMEVHGEHDAVVAVREVGPDSLHAWYERLAIASVSPMGEDRPDTEAALGPEFVLRVHPDGRVSTLHAPDFPETFEGVTDLSAQFYDFFPTRPEGGYRVGATWTDTLPGPPSTRPGTEMDVSRIAEYVVAGDSVVDGVPAFVVHSEATLGIRVEGPLPSQPGVGMVMEMSGPETNTFLVAKDDGRMLERTRSGSLSGTVEYVGMPQPVVMELTRTYENSIRRVAGDEG